MLAYHHMLRMVHGVFIFKVRLSMRRVPIHYLWRQDKPSPRQISPLYNLPPRSPESNAYNRWMPISLIVLVVGSSLLASRVFGGGPVRAVPCFLPITLSH